MRLAILSHSARSADAIGGQIAAQVRAALARGWAVRVFVNDGVNLHPAVAQVATVCSVAGLRRDRPLWRWLREADVVVVEYGGDFDLLYLLPRLGRRRQRVIFHDRGVTPADLAGEIRPQAELRGYAWLADRVVVDSRFIAEEVTAATGLPLERITVLPCCLPSIDSVSTAWSASEEESGWTLLYVGRLAANKRLPVLIAAAARLRDLPRPVRVVAVGRCDDRYAAEAQRCRQLAAESGVRLELTGAVSDAELARWFARADVVVQPSVHEGFGLPIIEALAAGRPVVVARAGASPGTVGDAGLSFTADDVDDLAETLRRVLTEGRWSAPGRVAVVSPRFGPGFAGGAERSLATMATHLRQAGWQVEVFTTCNEHAHGWRNTLPAGVTQWDGLTVRRFPIDQVDAERFERACEQIRQRRGVVSAGVEADYLTNSLGSTALLEALQARSREFAAIIVGPYLFRLTWQVARALPRQTLVVPCFHDEPYARLPGLRQVFSHAAGLLFHTPIEQEFAQEVLGLNQPRSFVIGTVLPNLSGTGEAARGRARVGSRYLIYCGRWSAEKGCDRLLACLRQVQREEPGHWRLVVLGGGANVPREPWLINLGFVDEATKRDLLAGAHALVHGSLNESLSLVVLESWAERVPVLVPHDSAVLRWQVERSGGGWCFRNAAEFSQLLAGPVMEEAERQRRGEAGCTLVEQEYRQPSAYAARLTAAVQAVGEPVAAVMRRRGPDRAAKFAPPKWEARWEELITQTTSWPRSYRVTVRLPAQIQVAPGEREAVFAVRLGHRGTATVAAVGPGRHALWLQLHDAAGHPVGPVYRRALPWPLLPGQERSVTVTVPLPAGPGPWSVGVRLSRRRPAAVPPTSTLNTTSAAGFDSDWQQVRAALARAHAQHLLPNDYVDVSAGWLAGIKSWLKRKLLNNFRRGYVDVLSRQQSQVNEELISCLCLLLEQVDGLKQQVLQLRKALRRGTAKDPASRRTRNREVRKAEKEVAQ
jgi:glycosyltransferase involved in cell wall biosynthesis